MTNRHERVALGCASAFAVSNLCGVAAEVYDSLEAIKHISKYMIVFTSAACAASAWKALGHDELDKSTVERVASTGRRQSGRQFKVGSAGRSLRLGAGLVVCGLSGAWLVVNDQLGVDKGSAAVTLANSKQVQEVRDNPRIRSNVGNQYKLNPALGRVAEQMVGRSVAANKRSVGLM